MSIIGERLGLLDRLGACTWLVYRSAVCVRSANTTCLYPCQLRRTCWLTAWLIWQATLRTSGHLFSLCPHTGVIQETPSYACEPAKLVDEQVLRVLFPASPSPLGSQSTTMYYRPSQATKTLFDALVSNPTTCSPGLHSSSMGLVGASQYPCRLTAGMASARPQSGVNVCSGEGRQHGLHNVWSDIRGSRSTRCRRWSYKQLRLLTPSSYYHSSLLYDFASTVDQACPPIQRHIHCQSQPRSFLARLTCVSLP